MLMLDAVIPLSYRFTLYEFAINLFQREHYRTSLSSQVAKFSFEL